MAAKRTRGRPSQGLSEARLEVRMPQALRRFVELAAKAEGVGESEWLRRAAHERALRQAAADPKLRAMAMVAGE